MKFEMKMLNQNLWEICDDSDRSLFSGSLGACRDWLDFQEARQQPTMMQFLSSWFSRTAVEAQRLTTENSTSESGVLN